MCGISLNIINDTYIFRISILRWKLSHNIIILLVSWNESEIGKQKLKDYCIVRNNHIIYNVLICIKNNLFVDERFNFEEY